MVETAPRSRRPASPLTAPATIRPAPPASISIAVPRRDDAGSRAWREYSEPIDHSSEARVITAAPSGSTRPTPAISAGPTSSASPPRPPATPSTTAGVGRWPPGRSASIATTQRGTSATSSAARPELIRCSAHTTPPLPPHSMSTPTTAAARHSPAVGRTAPRRRAHR